jgi:hypothetical protein
MQRFHGRCSTHVLVALLGLLLAPCGLRAESHNDAHQAGNGKLSTAELANIQYVRDNVAVGLPHQLNLADERQYAFVRETLRRGGHSAARSPQLYRLLAAAHSQGRPGKPVMLGATPAGATFQGINFVTEFGAEPNGTFYANAISSYPASQIPSSTYVSLTLVDRTANKAIAFTQGEVYATTNLQLPLSGAPVSSTDLLELIALFLTSVNNTVTAQTIFIESYGVTWTDACQTSPNYNPGINTPNGQQCQTSSATGCAAPGANPLKVCYSARIQSDCDYGCQGTSAYPPNIIFPIAGSANLGAAPGTPLQGSLYIQLQDTAGGGCILVASTDLSDITINGNVASWNLAPASFPNLSCVQTNGMDFNYSFQLYLRSQAGYLGGIFSSEISTSVTDGVAVPAIEVVQGCLPAGVKIRMADGSERAVETFQAYGDEKVRSHGAAASRAVTGTTLGKEEKPLVRLRDDHGHTLLLTEAHPVITSRGPVAAAKLVKGDVVLTENGEAALVAVDRQPSAVPVPVHNLRVGTQEEAARGESTFYANGILVGDQAMQRYLIAEAAKLVHLSQQEILSRLPREWHQDFLNSLAAAHP